MNEAVLGARDASSSGQRYRESLLLTSALSQINIIYVPILSHSARQTKKQAREKRLSCALDYVMETVDNESATDIPLVKKCRATARYLNAYFQIQPRERQHRFNDLDVHDPFERGDRPDSNPRTEVSIESIRGKAFNTDDGEGPYRVRDGDVGTDNCAFKPHRVVSGEYAVYYNPVNDGIVDENELGLFWWNWLKNHIQLVESTTEQNTG